MGLQEKKTQKLAMHAGGGTYNRGEKRNVLIVNVSEPGTWLEKCGDWLVERKNSLSAAGIRSCWQEGNHASIGQVRPRAATLLQGSQGGCAPLDLEQHTLRGLSPHALERSVTVFFVDYTALPV